jgi:hypothetical protein
MVSMDETQIEDKPQVSEMENGSLIEKFTEKEVKEAIFIWSIIRLQDLMASQ